VLRATQQQFQKLVDRPSISGRKPWLEWLVRRAETHHLAEHFGPSLAALTIGNSATNPRNSAGWPFGTISCSKRSDSLAQSAIGSMFFD